MLFFNKLFAVLNQSIVGKFSYCHVVSKVSGHVQTKKMNEHGKENMSLCLKASGFVHQWPWFFLVLSVFPFFSALHFSHFSTHSDVSCHAGHQLQETMKDAPHPADVVLQFRHYVGSKEWCQDPMVLGSDHMFRSMEEMPSNCAPRTHFSDRQIKEFNKTAEVISLAPWFLEAATAYLLKLIQDNIDGHSADWIGPDVGFGLRFPIAAAEAALPSISSVPPEALSFANRNPAPVTVNVRLRGKTRPFAVDAVEEKQDETQLPDEILEQPMEVPDLPEDDHTETSFQTQSEASAKSSFACAEICCTQFSKPGVVDTD